MISVRACQPRDLDPALNVINAAAGVGRSPRMTKQTFQRILPAPDSSGYENAIVATVNRPADSETVVGFLWWDAAKENQESRRFEGWVHPAGRHHGVGTALLTGAESFVREQQADSVQPSVALTGRSYIDIPGAEALFRLRGFAEVRRFYRMTTPLTDPVADVPLPTGVTLRTFRPPDLPALVEADNEIFTDHWGATPRSIRAWKHEMMEVRPHDPALWVLAWADDAVVGECLCHASRDSGPDDGWISIVGVRKEWRGTGLSRAVLAAGMRALQRSGYITATLHVDTENTPALRLYRRAGLEIARTRLHVAKTIS